MAYASTSDVNRVLGPHEATATTAVTLTDLGNIIDGISAQIDSVLKGAGVGTVPVTSSADSTFATFLIAVNIWGAAGEYLKGLFPEATGPGESPAFAFWQKKYTDTLKAWREGKDLPSGLTGGSNDQAPSTYFTRNPDEEELLGDLAEASMTKLADMF
tara:strand:- start:466 stop:939 length:474 start_codon:yes stop_codon:yes gene_type:complete